MCIALTGINKKKALLDLERIRAIVTYIQASCKDASPAEMAIAETELEDLVAEFAEIIGDKITQEHLEAASRDPEYFLRLIDQARDR